MKLKLRRLVPLAVALGAVAPLASVWASTGVCRTDPTVYLSNGVAVQMWDSINTDISHVNGVSYVLHVPKGVTITNIVYDSTGYLEHVSLVADQSGTHYSLDSTVSSSVTTSVTENAIRRDGTTASKSGSTDSTIVSNWCT